MSAGAAILRTPDAAFDGLPAWPHAPQWAYPLAQGGDTGPRLTTSTKARATRRLPCCACTATRHWAYLWRHMVPVFLGAGLRVVAPDLIGFGRSDKPVAEVWHSFERHRDSLLNFIDMLDLRHGMLACQDWGGIFGLTLPMARPERFSRLLVMNTTLATGSLSDGFRQWRDYSNSQPDLAVGKLLRRGKPSLSERRERPPTMRRSPTPATRPRCAPSPTWCPTGHDAPGAAISPRRRSLLAERWRGQSLHGHRPEGPGAGRADDDGAAQKIRGCPPPLQVAEGGHFVPEWGAPIAEAALVDLTCWRPQGGAER